LEELILIKR
jgi:hypothetical protein